MPRLKVFLSHVDEDKEFVRRLYHRLLDEGVEPWFDEEHLLPGNHIRIVIERTIHSSDVVIVLLSKTSFTKRGHFQWEIEQALKAASDHPMGAVVIIPVKIEECEIPVHLRHLSCRGIYDEHGHAKLVESLRERAASLGRSLPAKRMTAPSTAATRDAPAAPAPLAAGRQIGKVFLQTFWEQIPPAGPKHPGRFTVSLVGASGVGKTTLAFTLTRAGLNLLGAPRLSGLPYDYHLPLDETSIVVDHPAWSCGVGCWKQVTSYMETNSDLILFLVSANAPEDPTTRAAFDDVVQLQAPVFLLVNKVDSVRGPAGDTLVTDLRAMYGRSPIPISAGRGIGIADLRRFISLARRMYR